MQQKTIKVGVATPDASRERTLAIAAGTLTPSPTDPKIWITPNTAKRLGFLEGQAVCELTQEQFDALDGGAIARMFAGALDGTASGKSLADRLARSPKTPEAWPRDGSLDDPMAGRELL